MRSITSHHYTAGADDADHDCHGCGAFQWTTRSLQANKRPRIVLCSDCIRALAFADDTPRVTLAVGK